MENRSGSTSNSSKSYTVSPHLTFGPDGCQVLTSQGRRCGEIRTLQIIQEFKNMYETKMKQIDAEAGGDCVQAKINLQQDWIRDLTEQNDMLVRVVEELELEAADRVTMLEEKLQQTSKCACEVMESYNDFSLTLLEDFQKMDRMQSDVQNLLELIRRAKHEGNWDSRDLKFFNFDLDEVLNEKDDALNISVDNNNFATITDQRDKLLKQKNKKIKELEEKLASLVHGGEVEDAFQFKNLSQQYSDLKKLMMDMREALTAEVANKHDTILSLRRDVQVLEEQCRKADQQTHFKDDIIKELRKEIKQLKQPQQVTQLEEENQALKIGIEIAKKDLLNLQYQAEQYLKERDGYALKHKESLEVIETLQKENNITRERLKILQEEKDESIDSFHSTLMIELEEYEKKHRESVGKIDKLRMELEETKASHKNSMDQIITLNNENRYQNQRIENLQAELRLKNQKPKTNTVSVTASVSKRNFACNISPATNDKAINNVPATRIIATDHYDNQIRSGKASVGVEAFPGMLSRLTSISQLEKEIIATKANAALQVTPYTKGKKVGCNSKEDSPYRCRALSDKETTPKRTNMHVLYTPKKSFNKYENFPENKVSTSSRSRSLSPSFPQKSRLETFDDIYFDSFMSSNPSASTPLPKKTIPLGNRKRCVTDEECSPTCELSVSYSKTSRIHRPSKSRSPSPRIQEMTVTEISREPKSKSPSPSRTQNRSKTIEQNPKSKFPTQDVTIRSGSEIDEVLGHTSAKYVEATGLSDLDNSYVKSLLSSSPESKSRSQSPKGKKLETTIKRQSRSRSPKEKKLETSYTSDFEVDDLPSFAEKYKEADYLDLTGPQLLEAVEIGSQSDHRIPERNLMATSSSEEIQQIVQIEILDKVTSTHSQRHTSYSATALCPFECSGGNRRFNHSPRSPTQFQPLNWDDCFINSGSSVSSSSSTQFTKPVTTKLSVEVDNSILKSAIKRRPRSRSTSSATDDLQSVVNDLNESVSRIMMKSPNEKASRQRIAHLEEQLRGVNKKIKLIHNKDEMIKIQNDTLNIIQIELQALKLKEHEVEVERKRRGQEVENLKMTIKEMEKALSNSQEKSHNLQKAVELNMNTVNLLEVSEDHLKTEVTRQRMTITNLQDALVSTKHQLEEIQQKYSQEAQDYFNMMNTLMTNLQNAEEQCVHYNNRFVNASNAVEYLRDVNLDLEVENYELVQDLLLFESRLLKYQQMTKVKECLCGLKVEVRKLRQLKKHHELLIKFLKRELRQCGQELTALKVILESEGTSLEHENTALTSMVRELEIFTQSLQTQLGITEADLIREKKINQVQADRIEELQGIIGAKNIDINRYSAAYQDVKSKLDASVSKNRTLQESIKELQEQFNEAEMQKMLQGETEEICHGELDICLNSLQEVKFKLRTQYQQLMQKIQECKDLEASLKVQSNNAEIYKKDLDNTRIRYMDEAIELKRNIRELKEKLQVSENKIEVLNEEVKDSQAMLVESAQRELKLQQEFSSREQELSKKVHSSQAEEMRLLELVNQLEQQLSTMRSEILVRDQQLELSKTNIHKSRNDYNSQTNELTMAQKEVNVLKNELNIVIQKQGKLKSENEKLQEQVICLKNNIHFFNQRDQALAERLEAALSEINRIQSEKQLLQDKHEQISSEMVCLKDVLQKKTETAVNLEMELMQAKANRKELCAESRNVVASVRAWLDEQKMINEHLKEKLQRKNSLIAKLQKEKELAESSKVVCPALKQRADLQATQYYSQTNHPRNWSLGSRGSGSHSPASSNESGQPDWYTTYGETEYITPLADASPQRWIHRVESMTEELQRSNRYWKRKMNDNEYTVSKDE